MIFHACLLQRVKEQAFPSPPSDEGGVSRRLTEGEIIKNSKISDKIPHLWCLSPSLATLDSPLVRGGQGCVVRFLTVSKRHA